MRFRPFIIIISILLSIALTSCLDDDNMSDYSAWEARNLEFLQQAENARDDIGSPYYLKAVPDWASQTYVLMHWCIKSDSPLKIHPFDTSTVDMIYSVTDIDDNMIDNSFSMVANGDSIYRTRPQDMIIGVREALSHMYVGDSVSLVIPASAAYGSRENGKIKPYSTLKFNLKLAGMPDYLKP